MAGKHVGSVANGDFALPGTAPSLAKFRKLFPGTQVDRAYAEGRAIKIKNPAVVPVNPYVSPDPRYWAFFNGSFNVPNPPVFPDTDSTANVVQSGSLAFPTFPPSGDPV